MIFVFVFDISVFFKILAFGVVLKFVNYHGY